MKWNNVNNEVLNDKNIKLSVGRIYITIILLLVVIIGGTYAWLSYRSRESALVLTIGDLNNTQIKITPYQINETMIPVNTYENGVYSQIQAINNTNKIVSVSFYYNLNEITDELINNGLKYTIVSSDSQNGTYSVVKTGDFTDYSDDKLEILNVNLSATMIIYYRVYLWLDSSVGDQSLLQNTVLDVELNAIISYYPYAPFYVVYSETDTSLRFYRDEIEEGSTITTGEGTQIVATKVYEAYENDSYTYDSETQKTTSPWNEVKDSVTKIVVEERIIPRSTACWFVYFEKVNYVDVTKLDTSNVTRMSNMFYGMSSLTSLDVSNFDTSNVTSMSNMFYGLKGLTSLDVSNFDTSKVTTMYAMFSGMSSLTSLDVSNFDTSNVRSMNQMFKYCESLTSLDVSNFDTSNVTTMHFMFERLSNLTNLDVSNFDTSNVTDMSGMFNNTGCNATTFTLNLGDNFDTSNVTEMSGMFHNTGYLASTFVLDLGDRFDTSNVRDMSTMFDNMANKSTTFVLDLGDNFDTSKVTNMAKMFNRTGSFSTSTTINLGNKFNTSNVENMDNMFVKVARNNSNFVLDLGEQFTFKEGVSVTDFASECGAGKIIIPATVTNFPNIVFKGMKNLNQIVFEHSSTDVVTMPTAGSSTGAFYVDSNINTTITTENDTIKNYAWVTDNRTITIN